MKCHAITFECNVKIKVTQCCLLVFHICYFYDIWREVIVVVISHDSSWERCYDRGGTPCCKGNSIEELPIMPTIFSFPTFFFNDVQIRSGLHGASRCVQKKIFNRVFFWLKWKRYCSYSTELPCNLWSKIYPPYRSSARIC